MEQIRYGLLRAEDVSGRRATPGELVSLGERDASPVYAKARREARECAEARAAALEEQRLADEMDCIAGALCEGRWRLPAGSSISWAAATVDTKERDAYGVMQWTGAQPKVTGATLWPLPPMTLEELVKANLITTRGINHAAYERALGELVL
jgi:hypothetical protein